MSGHITENLNDTTSLTKCKDGYWLYDENRSMNLAMRAPSKEAALLEALEYYQNRLIDSERRAKEARGLITDFVSRLQATDPDYLEDVPCNCEFDNY